MQIYNTLTQKKEEFVPLESKKVKMYVCGMTVYDYCHIGHARVMVAFDMITRYLRFRGYDVNYVRNITDVDDKIINRAKENGEPFRKLTERFIAAMHEDEKSLNVLPPDQEPKATEHINEILQMIQVLVDNGHAYAAENGDVYFSIESFADYGRLNNKKVEELLAGVRIDVEALKRSPADFALWKSAAPGEDSWSSPWGEGRPGWHIECSAMSTQCLGNTFDIHGGGPDLKFPHHENEIAQSECATGQKFVNYWMHAGAVRVNKEKMSKSLGNFFTIKEVLETYPAEVVRFFLLSSHYRSQVDYSEASLQEAQSSLNRLYQSLRGLDLPESSGADFESSSYTARFIEVMDDDFNTPEALAVMFDLAKALNKVRKQEDDDALVLGAELKYLGSVLGILDMDPEEYFKSSSVSDETSLSEQEIESLIQQRSEARVNKDWAESDRIRDYLAGHGVILDDGREGTTWRRN